MQSIYAAMLVLLMFLGSVPLANSQTVSRSNDWNSLAPYANREIAVQAKGKKAVFGTLIVAGDNSLQVRSAKGGTEVTFVRGDVEKVWLAQLKGGRNTLKGVAIGAGAGAGIGLIAVLASSGSSDNDDGLIGAAIPLFAAPGALIGGVAGFFSRKKNKKLAIIYQTN